VISGVLIAGVIERVCSVPFEMAAEHRFAENPSNDPFRMVVWILSAVSRLFLLAAA